MGKQTDSIDLTSEHLKIVQGILSTHIPNVEVWAYGSRVKWTSTPKSDLDMVAHLDRSEGLKVYALREAFAESYLPFRVDFFIWSEVPEEFHEQIKKEYFVVQKTKHSANFLPKQWKKYRISDICDLNKNTYSPKEKWGYVNYLDTGSITQNRIESIQYIDLSVEKLPSRAKRKVSNGSIIFSTVRPNQRHYGFIENQPNNFLVSTGFAVLDTSSKLVDARFIYYSLTQNEVIKHFQAIAEQGACAYPTLKPSVIGDFELPLPPVQTQKQIAHVLSTIDKKIGLNQRINENLEQQAQAIFKSWFVDFEPFGGVMPNDWQSVLLDEMTSLVIKGITPKYNSFSDQLVINQKCIRNHRINVKLARPHTPRKINEKWLRYGDILINSTGQGTLGRAAQVWSSPTNFVVDSHITIVRSSLPIYIHYLGQLLISSEHIFEQMATGSTGQTDLPRERLKAMHILRPTQDALIDFNAVVERLTKKINDLQLESESLIQLRDTLLPKLMSGEIDVSQVKI